MKKRKNLDLAWIVIILLLLMGLANLYFIITKEPNNLCEVESFEWAEAYADFHCTHNVYTGYSYHPDNQYQGVTVVDSTSQRLWRGSIYQVTIGNQQFHHCLIS